MTDRVKLRIRFLGRKADHKAERLAGESGADERTLFPGSTLAYQGPDDHDPPFHLYYLSVEPEADLERTAREILAEIEGDADCILVEGQEVHMTPEALAASVSARLGNSYVDEDGREWHVDIEAVGLGVEAMHDFERSGAQLPHEAAHIVFRSGEDTLTEDYRGLKTPWEMSEKELAKWFRAARESSRREPQT
jgi:hypothetical protein